MLYEKPVLHRIDPCYKEMAGYPNNCTKYEDEHTMATFHYMEAHTENGIMGDATTASKEKGLALVNAYADNITEALADDIVWNTPV